jgi:hypothetical protein
MKTSDIKRLGEAWLKVTSGESQIDEARQMKDPKKDSMVQKGGKTIVIDKSKEKEYLKKGWQLAEKKKLDPVNDKENDKKFKDRKDKDIDNDGDVDSSDEYLHKRRKATDDAIDGGKKPAKNEKLKKENEDEEESDEPKKKKPFPPKKDGEEKDSEEGEESEEEDEEEKEEMPKVAGKKDDKKKVTSTAKTPEISKIGEELDLVDAIKDLHQMWESAAKQQKSNATKPEEIDSKDSPKAKEFTSAHKKSEKKYEDEEEKGHDVTFKAQGGTKPKSGKRPQDNPKGDTNIVKSTEAPAKNIKEGAVVVDANAQEGSVSLVDMAREQLAGNIKHDKEKEKNPFDARTKKAKEFLERMSRRR